MSNQDQQIQDVNDKKYCISDLRVFIKSNSLISLTQLLIIISFYQQLANSRSRRSPNWCEVSSGNANQIVPATCDG